MKDLPKEFDALFSTFKKPAKKEQLTEAQKLGIELLKIAKQYPSKKQ